VTRPAIIGEKGYSHAHYWGDGPQCGLATPTGACMWPKEPGVPWCNSHLVSFLKRMQASGYPLDAARAYLGTLTWPAEAVEVAAARYAEMLATRT
jgi:hypothetical protein